MLTNRSRCKFSDFQLITKTIIILRLATTGRSAYTPLAKVLYEIKILIKKNEKRHADGRAQKVLGSFYAVV